MPKFKGYSSDQKFASSWLVTDHDLIKIDLKNAFSTRLGERRMLPNLGTSIWDDVHQPLTDALKNKIQDECVRLVGTEQRVNLVDVKTTSTTYAIKVELTLQYNDDLTVDTLYLEFQRYEQAYFGNADS